jgi:hypothetical protein
MSPHRTDRVAFGFGVLFIALGLWYPVARLFPPHLVSTDWLAAIGLVALGLSGIVAALVTNRRAARDPAADPDR